MGKDTIFDVNAPISRQEMATVLFKYAKNYLKYDTEGRADIGNYSDADTIVPWAVDYMKWAIEYNIMKGKGKTLDPNASATRAEGATMLKN